MKITLPHTIENGLGEKILFKEIIPVDQGAKIILEAWCTPGAGPAMHVHYKQDECLTVRKGIMGYQVWGESEKKALAGETILFKQGVAHRFWNAGSDLLHLDGWVQPANTLIFFLTALYAAQKKSGQGQPEAFDGAYLMVRYKNEYDLPGIPNFVKKVIMPLTYFFGRSTGKYTKFKDAPNPL